MTLKSWPLLALLMSAAIASAQPLPPQPPDDLRATAPARVDEIDLRAAAAIEPLRLDVDDQLRLIVLGHAELTHVALVQSDGRAAFPVVGDMVVKGLTLQQVHDEIRSRLSESVNRQKLVFRPGDELQITVWRHPELTHNGFVQGDGMLALPLIGEIRAEGRTLAELRAEISQRLTEFLREPRVSLLPTRMTRPAGLVSADVSVLLEKARLRQVTVLGEVGVPGPQPVTPGVRIIDALAMARYNLNNADLDSVMLIRNSHAEVPEYKVLKLAAYLDGKAADQNLPLRPDDVIIVPKTTITKVGDFIERFFTRTRPVLDWWNALQQARYAADANRFQTNYYKSLMLP
jgi:polysaccharide export outer membrane protein